MMQIIHSVIIINFYYVGNIDGFGTKLAKFSLSIVSVKFLNEVNLQCEVIALCSIASY